MRSASARRTHLWSAVVVLVSFASGAITAVGFYRWTALPSPPPAATPEHRLDMLARELALTPDQYRRSAAIVARHHAAIEVMLRDAFPRIRAEQAALDRELRALLTAEQAARFDALTPPLPTGDGTGPSGPGATPRRTIDWPAGGAAPTGRPRS
jgi:hypothetical protein